MAKMLIALLVGLVGLSGSIIEISAYEFDSIAINKLAKVYSAARQDQSSVWLIYKSCYVYLYKGGGEPNNLLATFDVDDTITKSKSGQILPKDADDWQFLADNTKDKIQQTVNTYPKRRLLLFTNQNGIATGEVSLESIQQRLEANAKALDLPCTIFVAIEKDEFRKPNRGMYELFVQAFNGNKQVDLDNSFYCGDAVAKSLYPSFSDGDLEFARNIGLLFQHPQEFLHDEKPRKLEKPYRHKSTKVDTLIYKSDLVREISSGQASTFSNMRSLGRIQLRREFVETW